MVRIEFNEVQHLEGVYTAEMTILDGTAAEQVSTPISIGTARLLQEISGKHPFRTTKPGFYRYELSEITQGPGLQKTLVIEIYRGRSRLKQSIAIDGELFLMLWNILHFQVLPSQLPQERRRR